MLRVIYLYIPNQPLQQGYNTVHNTGRIYKFNNVQTAIQTIQVIAESRSQHYHHTRQEGGSRLPLAMPETPA